MSKTNSSEYVLFWFSARKNGWMSNFHPKYPITVKGVYYPTTEHYFQSMKTDHEVEKALIISARTASDALTLGINCTLKEDWEEVKDSVMYDAIKYKVEQHPRLKKLLLKTGDSPIGENSPCPSYWGLGKYRNGGNMLGKLWMKLREEIGTE
jgi:ribA/ribD-fused uncharacterized protein